MGTNNLPKSMNGNIVAWKPIHNFQNGVEAQVQTVLVTDSSQQISQVEFKKYNWPEPLKVWITNHAHNNSSIY